MFSFSTKCSVVSFREQTPFFVLGVKGKPKKSSSHTGLAFKRFQVNFIRFKEYHDLAPLFTVVFFSLIYEKAIPELTLRFVLFFVGIFTVVVRPCCSLSQRRYGS